MFLSSAAHCQIWGKGLLRPIQPAKVTQRPITPLSGTVLNNRISRAVMQQPLAQLRNTAQLAQLTGPQRTLLLAHKFAQETQFFPRTVIMKDGQILPPEQYTPEQKFETSLGKRIRNLLENPDTPAEIRTALLTLQRETSPKFQTDRLLENLNEWIEQHQAWPREQIEHDGPLTVAEEYEISLALATNSLVFSSRTLPRELLEQIESIREYYDPSYVSAARQAENVNMRNLTRDVAQRDSEVRQHEWGQYGRDTFYNIDYRTAPRQPNFYNNDNLPIDPATHRQQVLPTPGQPAEALPLIKMKDITHRLLYWLAREQRWPQPKLTSQKPFGDSLKDLQEDLLYQDVLLLQRDNPQLIEFLYSSWRDNPLNLQNPFSNTESVELQEERLQWINNFYPTESPEVLSNRLRYRRSWLERGNSATHELVTRVRTWKQEHRRWPQVLPWEFPYTYTMYEEIALAKNLEDLVHQWAPRNKKNASLDEVLSSPTPYSNFYLEQLRQLYQQENN